MAKQIDGQLSFDFMETFNTKEISMDDYMNKPENTDIIKKKTEKKKQNFPYKSRDGKPTATDLPVKETENPKVNTIGEQNALSSTKEIHSDKEDLKNYQKASDYVKEHRGITIGTIMRLYRLSANDASKIFQKLMENKVIDDSGRLHKKGKKEL